MEKQEPEWGPRLVARIAAQVRKYRIQRDLSTQQLADACAERGWPLKRSVLSNLELGYRETITVPELLILARVLGVSPVELVFPVGQEPTVEVLPGEEQNTWDAIQWVTGESPFKGDVVTVGGHEVRVPSDADLNAWESTGNAINLMRKHGQRLVDVITAHANVRLNYRRVAASNSEDERIAWIEAAQLSERRAQGEEDQLRQIRRKLRKRRLTPPGIPSDLAHLDQPERDSAEGSLR